jgi:L-threonylcarbamoyladenylate synthase
MIAEVRDLIPPSIIEILNAGGVVAYPTSTQPGLASLPTRQGLDTLFALKQRPDHMPVSLGVASIEQAKQFVEFPELAEKLLSAFAQGSITVILPALQNFDQRIGGENIAIRILAHPLARKLTKRVGAITATSANQSGELPEMDSKSAGLRLGLPQQAILPGLCGGEVPSTIIQFIRGESQSNEFSVTIMREGVIPRQDVMLWLTKVN